MQSTAQPLARGVVGQAGRVVCARRLARPQPRSAAFCRAALTVPDDAYLPVVRLPLAPSLGAQGRLGECRRRLSHLAALSQAKAHCFEKVNGKLVDRFVIEPVASAALEALNIGAPAHLHTQHPKAVGFSVAFPAVTFPRRPRVTRTPHTPTPCVSHHPGMQTSFVTVYGTTVGDVYTCATDKLPVSAPPSRDRASFALLG